ncbi:UDP-4-amino-4,6-dideoxy-N-acetyl-beta-L-altrosamine transaminase [bacterium]|nr:MAG: UDP-4-amino-4,6-dideoxy-N-acetyl-beta-L-altrosamine transaminase [bacterium]
MRSIPYGRQDVSAEDIEAVVETLRSDWLTQGPKIGEFERVVAARCGARHAMAVSNGTAALHLACLALDLGPGDVLWTTPNTFVASANCARYCGADVDFVDIDERSYNLSAAALRDKLLEARRQGRLPKAVVAVAFSGQPADMAEIAELARTYGFAVIEDASHALGASYRGHATGDGTYADMTVFSFHPVKLVTTAEGGMVVTNRDDLAARLRRLRSHGITREPSQMEGEAAGGWYYEQLELGFNYRMTDLQAALGISQMGRLERFLERRRALAARYGELLDGLPLSVPWQAPDRNSAWHLYVVRIDSARTPRTRREVFDALRARGILVSVHYIPVHLQPYYRRLGFSAGAFPVAERYYEQALSLPLYYGLSDGDQERVAAALAEVLQSGA